MVGQIVVCCLRMCVARAELACARQTEHGFFIGLVGWALGVGGGGL